MAWKFILATTSTSAAIGELANARARQLQITLNKPGSLSFSLHMEDTLATRIAPITTFIQAYRNGVLKWSGPVWTIEEDVPDNFMKVTAMGWLELLNHQIIMADVNYSAVDAGTIATNLLALANAQRATGITAGSVTATQTRTRAYKAYQNIGQEIAALSSVEAGFDYEVTASKVFNVYSQRMTDQTSIVFGYNFGPNNVASVNRTSDASTLLNKIIVLGKNASILAEDNSSETTYGIFADSASLSEVTGTTVSSGLTWAPVDYASTANIPLVGSYPFVIDGASFANQAAGKPQVLLKDQSTASQNGLYTPFEGPVGTYTLYRNTDASVSGDFVVDKTVLITSGATNINKIFKYSGAASPTIDTTAISFTQVLTETQILAAFGNAELAVKSTPRVTYTFTPFPETDARVPNIFSDYYVGDKVYLTAKLGTLQITNQAIRIFGATLSIDENGNSSVTSLETSPV